MKTPLALICLVCLVSSSTTVQGYIATPLVGYQQGVKLTITPGASTTEQCSVYGVPTPTGYAETGPTPLYLYTPKNTGTHVLEFDYDTSVYSLGPFLAPDKTSLQIDDTIPEYPLISFDSTLSPEGESGYVTLTLYDKVSGATLCESQIQLYVDAPLGCLPSYGGAYTPGAPGSNPPIPGGGNGGVIVIPGNIQIYAPTYIQQTVINQFITVNNIQINNIVNNVNVIQNVTIINPVARDVEIEPKIVNCTTEPTHPSCNTTGNPTPPGNSPTSPTPTPTPGSARGPPPGNSPAVPPATTVSGRPTTPPAARPTTPPGSSPPPAINRAAPPPRLGVARPPASSLTSSGRRLNF